MIYSYNLILFLGTDSDNKGIYETHRENSKHRIIKNKSFKTQQILKPNKSYKSLNILKIQKQVFKINYIAFLRFALSEL